MLGLKRGTVELYPHQAEWDVVAAETVKRLRTLFGSIAVDIQHVGSTSVRYIKAKPIIDIAIAVRSFDDVTPLIPILEENGIWFRHHIVDGDMLFACGDFEKDTRTHHIHVVEDGSDEWVNYINFRDYIRNHEGEGKRYDALKSKLMEEYADQRGVYTAHKNEFITRTLSRARLWRMFGTEVTVTVDRPMGSRHPEHGFEYPVNYGFIDNIKGGDGEAQDAYVLGVDHPCDSFTGVITGMILRNDDNEDKLVVVPHGTVMYQPEIMEKTHFQEQYFDAKYDQLYHKSCGAVVYRRESDGIKYLLVYQKAGKSWSVPKGHMEYGETELDTVKRELYEEARIKPYLTKGFREEVTYDLKPFYKKVIALYLSECRDEPQTDGEEIGRFLWASKEEAQNLLGPRYPADLFDKAEKILLG